VSLQIDRRVSGSATVLDLSGRLTAGSGADQLREVIRKAIADGVTNVVLNMAAVEFMDSAGLSAVVVSSELLRNRGGLLRILNAQGPVRHVLQITRLDRVLTCFDDEKAALASLSR
jgi:anti-sigma B factor antagonist